MEPVLIQTGATHVTAHHSSQEGTVIHISIAIIPHVKMVEPVSICKMATSAVV